MNVVYADPAIEDLRRMWEYYAERTSIDFAQDFLRRVKETLESVIVQHPRAGRARPEFAKNARSFPVLPYIVFYRIEGNDVHVQRILHGRRDIKPPMMSLLMAV